MMWFIYKFVRICCLLVDLKFKSFRFSLQHMQCETKGLRDEINAGPDKKRTDNSVVVDDGGAHR